MNKSILLIDTPKSCRGCKFFSDADSFHELFWCDALMKPLHFREENFDMRKERHPQCPLQDTTELLEALEEIGNESITIFDRRKGTYSYCINETDEYEILYKVLSGEDN